MNNIRALARRVPLDQQIFKNFQSQKQLFLFLDPNLCMTRHCLRAADMYRNHMNVAMKPCDNFYEFGCAHYPNLHPIPHYHDHFNSFVERNEHTFKILAGYIKSINLLWPRGFQKVRKFYDLCMNEDQRRQVGYDTLKEELAVIGIKPEPQFHLNTQPRNDYGAILARIHRYSLRASSFLFKARVASFHLKMELNTLIIGNVVDPQMTPEQNIPQRSFPAEDELFLQSHERYMLSVVHHMYKHFKVELTEDMKREIQIRVKNIQILEQVLQQINTIFSTGNVQQRDQHWRPPLVRAHINNVLTGGEIQIDFNEYLETLLDGFSSPIAPPIKEILATPDYSLMITLASIERFTAILEILQQTKSAIFESYIWWRVVESLLDESPTPLYEAYRGYLTESWQVTGLPYNKFPREMQCLHEVRTYFGKFIGYALARKTNGQEKKKKVMEMLENITLSFEESIQRTAWADDDTKKATLKKIKTMTAFVGFDDSILETKTINEEYKNVEIHPRNFCKTIAVLHKQLRQKELSKLFTANDFKEKPECNPADPLGAHYIREYNLIVVPMTSLQFPHHDLGLEVFHYATLGFTVAHEMGHSIDATGSQYDAEGNMRYTMSEQTEAEYNKIYNCFINAYNNLNIYIPEKGFCGVNGLVSVDENMADWQGFNMAMMAYKKFVEKHGPEPKLPGIFSEFNHLQLFSLAYSNKFCIHAGPKFLMQSALTNMHAPAKARVNGVLKNSRQFSEAFGCAPDAPMNVPNKCEIWL